MFTSISTVGLAVEQIPLKIRCCFVRSLLLLTRYPQLGGKQTLGTYYSPIVGSYSCDRIPDAWYETDAAIKLCQLFALPNSYAQEIQDLLTRVDLKITRQQKIIEALIDNFDRLNTQKDVLSLFQALFGNIPLTAASINCLTTKMQITFMIDYQDNQLKSSDLWCNLSELEQREVSRFLEKLSQFSFQQFANFPSFNNVKIQNNNLGLWRYLTEVTGYSQSEIVRAIASSVNIISANKAESFLLHDLWGHYWQSILITFSDDYLYLSQVDQDLNLDSFINTGQEKIYLRQLFKTQNKSIYIDVPLAKQFFHTIANQRIAALSTHLIGEMLADINEYKWLSQNRDRQALLNSSSIFPDSPTKLDLTIKDWDFLHLPTLETLIKLSPALSADLINEFQIKDSEEIDSLRIAVSNLHHIFLIEYINHYQSSIKSNYIVGQHALKNTKTHTASSLAYLSDRNSNNLFLSLTELQNILNQLYTYPVDNDLIPFQDLILLFVGNYYSVEFERDITQVNYALKNHFYSCWQLLNSSTSIN